MKGTLKIEVDEPRITISSKLEGVDDFNKIALLHSICDVLEIDTSSLIAFVLLRDEFNNASERIKIDGSAISELFKKGE